MPHLPIENYGIIGDMHTVSLLGMKVVLSLRPGIIPISIVLSV